MLIKQAALCFIGLCSGATVAAGVFAFITMLGIIPRLAARTNTADHILCYENAIILGGTLGNIWILFELPMHLSVVMVVVFGIFSGIFVGCLYMALAETLRVLPIMVNRIQLKEGFPIIVAAIAAGKVVGTLIQYFF